MKQSYPYISTKEVMVEHIVVAELILAIELGVPGRKGREALVHTANWYTQGVAVSV